VILVEGKGALQTWLLEDRSCREMLYRRNARIFLFEDYWSRLEPQKTYFNNVLDNYKSELEEAHEENGRTFNIYRITLPPPSENRKEGISH